MRAVDEPLQRKEYAKARGILFVRFWLLDNHRIPRSH
jgi:hypothetical protein